jgi:hypothetical protein
MPSPRDHVYPGRQKVKGAERHRELKSVGLGAVSLTLKVLHFEGCKPLVEKAFYETAIV